MVYDKKSIWFSKLNTALKQAALILILATLIALTTNEFREAKLPIFSSNSEETLELKVDCPLLTLEEAIKKYQEGKSIFIDARPKQEYNKEHIKGAINISLENLTDILSLKENITLDTEIIIYSASAKDELSINLLAMTLKDIGFHNIKLFLPGFSEWKKSKLPIETTNEKKN
ncbi:MAG: hypothetical protein DRP09_19315 [Candidatus Thorarchaeota archaeon]|nr:MAG: hypothetical protein DRP09_19315 [Candidatus Thorarchaeota archaeon]